MYSEFYDKHLRTFSTEQADCESQPLPLFGSFPELFRIFQQTTGLKLELVKSQTPVIHSELPNDEILKKSLADLYFANDSNFLLKIPIEVIPESLSVQLVLSQENDKTPFIAPQIAVSWAKAIADVLAETYRLTLALRQSESEIAALTTASQPIHLDTSKRFSQRLTSLLKKGAITIDCQAASLYLLDNETTSLKLRSCWGLPDERLTEPARPLRGALADLEALLGNAVILNESYLYELWKAPECFSTSICVPIQSSNAILGTIWFFSDQKNDFCIQDLQILEIVSGRIALELEHFALVNSQKVI
ncbi:MAG: GAF domain-containing protein [Planctomycetia bacterium]|nr:GAF domain-containing protein [Planctomycetia bacterium]